MLSKGQIFYRFKLDLSGCLPALRKHTFEIIDEKEQSRVSGQYMTYKPRCIENSMIQYKDGYYLEEEQFEFNTVKPSGNCIYVLLEEDDAKQAKTLISEYLESRIAKIKQSLINTYQAIDLLNRG